MFPAYPIAGFSDEVEKKHIVMTAAIKSSGGSECFKSLDATDLENLGQIIYIRNKVARNINDNTDDFVAKEKEIEKNFSGEKKAAAYALLYQAKAQSNQAAYNQIINKAIFYNNKKIDEVSSAKYIKEAKKNGVNLVSLLNSKLASSWGSAQLLRSKGARVNPNGDWEFDKKFNFGEIKNNPKLKNALSDFFPDQVKELSQSSRGFAVIGNRVVKNIPDPSQKQSAANPTNWIWQSADRNEHFQRILEIQDHFLKKAEAYARASKRNGNWAVITGAAIDTKVCGVSFTDILAITPGAPSLMQLARYFAGKKIPNMNDSWEKGLNSQLALQDDLGNMLTDLIALGASKEMIQAMRDQLAALNKKSITELDNGLIGTKRAMFALTCAPLAVVTAPLSFPAAGASLMTTIGFGLTVVSIATPTVLASINIIEATKKGDGLLCSMIKEGSILPVKYVESFRWGAMGPVLGKLAPTAEKALKLVNLGPQALKITLITPGAILVGVGAVSKIKEILKNSNFILELQEELAREKNPDHANAIREILKKAKAEEWDAAVGLLMTSVSIHDIAKKALEKVPESPKIIFPEEEKLVTSQGDGHNSKKITLELDEKLEDTNVPSAIKAPVVTPVAASVATPVSASVATPVSASVATPVSASVATPVSASVATPVSASVATPVSASVATPVLTSVATPTSASVETPVIAPAQDLPGVIFTSAKLTVAAISAVSDLTVTYKDAKAGDAISIPIEGIHPGGSEISRAEVNTLVDNLTIEAKQQYPNDPKAIEKYMQRYVEKNILLGDILPDGTFLLTKGLNTAAAFQSLIENGLLKKNEFTPKIVVGHNYNTDPSLSNISKEEAMDKILKKLYDDHTIYLPQDITEKVESGKITLKEAFKKNIPTSITKVGDRPFRSLISNMEFEMGISFGNSNKIIDFYSAEKLKKNGVNLPADFDPNNSLERAGVMKQIIEKPSYIKFLKDNVVVDEVLDKNVIINQRKEMNEKINQLAGKGQHFFAAYESFLRALIKANPKMEEKILKMKLTPFDPKYDDTNKIFIDYTKKELGFFNLP